ncbi:MAG TPA: L-serine ammonia-lyase, iron-sulfur-dependent, subunit alpha [Phascolarctobacterium faecium]|uniref:L-cysteine desulfidase family protein n=1 Tax=Phascolarctobacterium faecium TaxID=33025 RepID=UPI00242DB615|nr:L-serine ammonia-lyase, iron-sulfur-dependent, subunit alpha [Phascolarctobacterium faecium]HJI09728.1 L-serine ammonia-lyase, iron-sulfur-dependent, subunit alpha [Phascolarctobacterium faecium]
MITRQKYQDYINVLKEELIPAMGCTEPIAIAYAGAIAREHLGCLPERVEIEVSGNIIKNVKSVIVPNTGGLRGIEVAAAAGIVAGDAAKELKVISEVSTEAVAVIHKFLESTPITVNFSDSKKIFDIMITVYGNGHSTYVRICEFHTNIVEIREDDKYVLQKDIAVEDSLGFTDRGFMNVQEIIEFADTARIEDVKDILDLQIEFNVNISEEGLAGDYGANIGKVLLKTYGTDDVKIRAKAKAAAGSDARMNGCEMPVVINSGSGNQGITASIPVIEYAKELGVSDEKRYRALLVSNLITIHLKSGIGRLSAYCGAVSAGCASGAGIAYLYGGGVDEVSHTIVNSLAITSGIICDGAKASCAAKIATAIDAGILGYHMYKEGQQFYGGDGIVSKGVENTIKNVGQLAKEGMATTDQEILKIMTKTQSI